ncbi:Beta-lactamase domain containing protein [Aphelenchoides bicaudatus]|nr:Beta-lactamase domain containing protein [Aphelenchoides bicaudatus]
MFSVNDQVQKPEPAHVWHERKTTTKVGPGHRFDLRKSSEQEADLESKLALIDNEVERDPRDWELKMRQLSRELSTILHRLKNEKEEKGLIPKTEFKVAVQSLGNIQRPKSATKNTPDTKSVFEVIDDDAGENDPNEDENHEETPKPDSTQRLTLGSLKINRKNLPNHQGSTNGKAYVTILREGIARQTDINEYVFIASITLVRDSNKVILVDTGLATDINGRTDLLTKLSKLDIAPPNVDYVITTHGHPDHAGNTNDFPDAIHFQGNMLHHRTKFNFSDLFEKDVHQLTPNVQLIKTPGHTPDDITIGGSVAVCGDVFVAEEDQQFPLMWKPMAWSERTQEASRRRLICDADFIVPGHGKVFKVTDKMKSNFKC